jgi:hypothetical protein
MPFAAVPCPARGALLPQPLGMAWRGYRRGNSCYQLYLYGDW